jgi:hypothetical protein
MDLSNYRFDSKRFCRDCRRNVIREFKELKELKRMRREPRCTTWFCVANTTFQYETGGKLFLRMLESTITLSGQLDPEKENVISSSLKMLA